MPEETLADNIDKDKIYERLLAKIAARGPYKVYQGWERINITGQRPTELRFQIYRLADWINSQTKVLDLGSNVGFMALACAERAKEVWGIERYDYWIEIAELAQCCLGITNCRWFCGDALAFKPPYEFDLMLSLSFHHWGPKTFAKYVKTVYKAMLAPGGHLLFESHKIGPREPFEQYAEYLQSVGFQVVRQGTCQCPTTYPRPNPYRKWYLLELMQK